MSVAFTLRVRGGDEWFTKPGHYLMAYIYGDEDQLADIVGPWSDNIVVISKDTLSLPDDDDYVLPAGALRLYLDLSATYGDPPCPP